MKSSVRGAVAPIAAILLGVALLVAAEPVVVSSSVVSSPLVSGLKPGEKVTTIFEPLNVNGPNAGEPHCLVCENGLSPVAMIWARDVGEPLVRLIAKLDAAAVKHAGQEMGSFAVFIGDETALEPRLKKVADEQQLKKLVLSINLDAVPAEYNLAPDADVTVMLYNRHEVFANHAFRKGELDDGAIARILADLPKIVGDAK